MDTITKAKLTIAGLSTSIGLQTIKNNLSPEITEIKFSTISNKCAELGITTSQLDVSYYSTDWDTYKIIADTIYSIVKNFKWTADKFDCDDRSAFQTSLCALLFGLNTCAGMYCKITNVNTGNSDMHWANCIIDKNGELYLFDADNSGVTQKITSKTFTAGVWKYEIQNLRIY